ncbi:cytochrome P450 [Novosphingobium sp. B 225]|uniref:cytochrome P450 n=1 Tax=Novosphingobium sp. B 225 TaxID=1961849 RepID=UPI001C3D3AF9|nr:cytochrome P450 [Novosphingobium sp. B 225]
MPVPVLDFDPFDEAVLADPYAHHDRLRDAGPVVYFLARGCFGMARYGDVAAALKDWQTFGSGRGVGLTDFALEEPWRPPSLLLEADPPLHDRTRGLMNKVASLSSLRAVMPEWRETARTLVSRLVGAGPFDAVPALAQSFPLAVFPRLIGLAPGGEEHLLTYAATAFNAFGPRNRLLEQSLAQAAEATAWVSEACRRENLLPHGWGMQVHEAADRGDCTADEADRLVRSFLTAGLDTTVNGIANVVHALALHPDQWQRLRAEPALGKRAFEESLRWNGVVQTFFRTTTRPVQVGGHELPEGAKVLLFYAAANRDPRQWNRGDMFDITRSTSGHLGFGFGIHQCLGQMVARFEAEAALGALIETVGELRLTGPVERPLNNTLHPIGRLPIELVAA